MSETSSSREGEGRLSQSLRNVLERTESIRQIEPDKIHFADLVGIFVRAWPYIRPMIWHVLGFMGLSVLAMLVGILAGVVILTMIYNNVILDAPIAPIAAAVLFLEPAEWVHVETLTREQRYELVPYVVLLAVFAGTIASVLENACDYYRVWVMQMINQNLRLHLMSQLNHLSLKFHAESKTGDAIYRLFQDSAMVTQIIQALVIDPILTIARFLIGVVVVFAFSPVMALAILATWIPMFVLANKMSVKLRFGFQKARQENSRLTSTIQESIDGIRTIKVNALERERQELFEDHSVNAFVAAHDARVRLLLFSFVAFVCGAVPLVVVELSAAILAYQSATTFMTNFLLAFGFATWNLASQDSARIRMRESVTSIEGLLVLWGRAQDMAMGLNRVYEILDITPEVENRDDARTLESIDSDIEFNHLAFSYPEREVFKDLSFTAELGQITAIMGPTGTGKSTLMLLLLRMFEYHGGSIQINGRDLSDYTYESVRDKITLATQENILFSDTVRANIRYARPTATDAEVEEAAHIACADSFIERLPQRYSTFLGERAGKLSSGQRQRLVIARAILKNTPILVLDEPTASLDAETEIQIMANIKSWAKERTVFLVTHRLSTIRQADRIVYIDDGVVADSGTHEELMKHADGNYRSFVETELDSVTAGTGAFV